jgi:REP element-mobilizing transposase RayT
MQRKYEYRRTLPHYQGDNKAIFATFATHHRWHLPEVAREIVVEACLHLDGTKCALHGLIVMPDHVHMVFTPLVDDDGPISLPEILQKAKSESAHRINKLLGRKGRVWQDESFDHVLRREEGIDAKLEYIRLNPVRAGLVQEGGKYKWMWFEGCVQV